MNMGSSIRLNKGGLCAIFLLLCVIIFLYYHTGTSTTRSQEQELISLKELLSASVAAAIKGGNEVKRIRIEANLHMQSKGKTKEGVNDPVTDGDMLSHVQMYYSLLKSFPGLEIISEEHDARSVSDVIKDVMPAPIRDPFIERKVASDKLVYMSDVRVWIDPLDATKEYTEDLRQYVTTMVCVAVRGVPTIGVIHKPFSNITYWGWLDHGMSAELSAMKNKIKSSGSPTSLTAPRIIVSISHQGSVLEVAKGAFGQDVTVIPAAGAGYKILEVIDNKADLYVHTSLIKKWDLCAGHALLRSVGGVLTTLADPSPTAISYDDRNDYKVEDGLLASIHNQNVYFDKLKELKKP